MKKIRYDLIGASRSGGIRKHPELVMKDHGFTILNSTPCPIADCWIFEVEDFSFPYELPEFLEVLN